MWSAKLLSTSALPIWPDELMLAGWRSRFCFAVVAAIWGYRNAHVTGLGNSPPCVACSGCLSLSLLVYNSAATGLAEADNLERAGLLMTPIDMALEYLVAGLMRACYIW